MTKFWKRQWHPTPVLLPGKSHGQRSLVGCSPWGRTESDATERLHFHFSLSCTGEGNRQPTPVFLPGESQGRWSLVGCRLRGHTELDTTEVTQQQQHDQVTIKKPHQSLKDIWGRNNTNSIPILLEIQENIFKFILLCHIIIVIKTRQGHYKNKKIKPRTITLYQHRCKNSNKVPAN